MGLLISGGGGSGKTTQLYRLAYEVVNDEYYAGVNVLWLPSDARFTFDELANLIASNQQPAIVFIDGVNINDVIDAISEQIDDPTARKYPVLLVFAARLNEWHNAGGPNVPFGTFREITLSTLSDSEIRAILSRLEDNDQLYKLTTLSPDERFAVLKSKSGGELLVAMLEATQGKRFYEIVLDEYHNIRRVYYEAAKAYELICFFFMYDVLIPEELLITFLNCVDVTDFESRVMEYTRLVIVRHPSTRFGIKYRPRHREVANILISQLSDYDTPEKKLKQVSVVLRNIDADETQQRYVVLDFFRGYIKAELKRGPSVDFENQVEDLRQFFLTNARKLTQLQERAITAGHLPELSLWSAIYKDIRLIREEIRVLRAIVRIKANDPVANYRLAKRLMRTAAVSHSPEVIAEHFFRAFAGGNRNVKFLYDYVGFCLKTRQYDYIENIIDNVRDFISYTDEEEEIKKTIGALLDGYRFTKDRSKLSNDFAEISSHIHATEKLSPADEFAYIDLIETGSTLDRLKQYEEYLTAVHPNRPKGALLRVARFASRISEERQKALRFYREYYETYIGNDPHSRDFEIMYEYARLAVELNSQPRRLTLSILRQCVQLRPLNVRCFALQARYAMKVGIKELALQAAKDGLKAAAARGRLGHPDCAMLRDILDRLEQST